MGVQESFLIFVDTETTGLRPGIDEVCEIASILTDLDLREVDRFEAKILVTTPPPADVAQINGYLESVWAREAKPFQEWKTWLGKHVRRGHVAVPVGHNVGFDREMIDLGYYKRVAQFCPLAYRKIDTAVLAMMLKISGIVRLADTKLETVAKALGFNHTAHRAMGDCEASKFIFDWFRDRLAGVSKPVVQPAQVRQVVKIVRPVGIKT